jgi:hypothetical protein
LLSTGVFFVEEVPPEPDDSEEPDVAEPDVAEEDDPDDPGDAAVSLAFSPEERLSVR